MRRLSLIVFGGLTVVALAGCSGGASPTPAAGTTAAPSGPSSAASAAACAVAPAGSTATVSVTIKDFKFAPDPVEAKVGDVITWANNDTAPHTASLEDGSCGTDSIAPGATGSLVLGVAGTYKYKCTIHPTQMNGFTIEVK